MNLLKLLTTAGVPEALHAQAIACLAEADKWLGVIPVKVRIGYEIDNLWNGTEQAWYPIAGHNLRAPLTWSVLPGRDD